MKILYFVRHGQTSNNLLANNGTFVNNEPLNSIGKSQSTMVSEYFFKNIVNKPSIIVTSPLLRTQQTALTISEKLNIPVISSTDLAEFNPGLYSNKKIYEILELYKKESKDDLPYFKLQGGESWIDISERTTKVVREYIDSLHKDIIIVSHASIIQICINRLLEFEPRKWLELNDISNGEIKIVSYERGGYKLLQ